MSWYLNNEDKLIFSSRNVYEGGRYIQADYIEFDWVNNGGWIDTGIVDDGQDTWFVNFELLGIGAENWICGTVNHSRGVAWLVGTDNGSGWYYGQGQWHYTSGIVLNQRISCSKPDWGNFPFTNTIYLGCRNWGAEGSPRANNGAPSHFRVYQFDISRSGTALCTMRPAYDTVNAEWGMYDEARNQFFGNAGGEGTSIAGGYYSEDVTDVTPEVLAFDYNDPPASMWTINNDEVIVNGLIPDRLRWQRPYPYSMWFIDHEDNDIIINELLPDILEIPPDGAFTGCRNLRYVRIPKSVMSIGPMAFNGTDLKIVCLSRRCKFSYTSFPPDCRIIYYEDIYPIDYDMLVAGVNAYRITDTIARDEELPKWEIP